jgi:hypothetical protein
MKKRWKKVLSNPEMQFKDFVNCDDGKEDNAAENVEVNKESAIPSFEGTNCRF